MTKEKTQSNHSGCQTKAQVDATAEQVRRLVAKLKEKETPKSKSADK